MAHAQDVVHGPFYKILGSLICETVETMGSVDLSPDRICFLFLGIIVAAY